VPAAWPRFTHGPTMALWLLGSPPCRIFCDCQGGSSPLSIRPVLQLCALAAARRIGHRRWPCSRAAPDLSSRRRPRSQWRHRAPSRHRRPYPLRRHWSNPPTTVMLTETPLTIEDLPTEVDSGLVELDDGGEILDVEVGDEGLHATARGDPGWQVHPQREPGAQQNLLPIGRAAAGPQHVKLAQPG
jgi:hypothetical protein